MKLSNHVRVAVTVVVTTLTVVVLFPTVYTVGILLATRGLSTILFGV